MTAQTCRISPIQETVVNPLSNTDHPNKTIAKTDLPNATEFQPAPPQMNFEWLDNLDDVASPQPRKIGLSQDQAQAIAGCGVLVFEGELLEH